MAMTQILLELTKVQQHYMQGEQRVDVLRGASLALRAGELTALVGPSGCGKSTMLNIAGLLEKPTGGDVIVDGASTARLGQRSCGRLRRSHIGFVFQFHHLLPDFSVVENILMPAWIKNDKSKLSLADKLLETLQLTDIKDKYPLELSGGEKQRVAVLRALINGPRILFADEPTGNLDEKNALLLVDLFMKINRDYKVAILLTTHNLDLAAIGEKRYELKSGLLKERKDVQL